MRATQDFLIGYTDIHSIDRCGRHEAKAWFLSFSCGAQEQLAISLRDAESQLTQWQMRTAELETQARRLLSGCRL